MPSDQEDEEDLTREQIEQSKQHLREKYGSLFDDALALFFRLDLMDLECGLNTDEYSPEVRAILLRIHEASSAEELRLIIYEVFKHFFTDDEEVEPPERYRPAAEALWAEYLKCRPNA